MWAVSQFAEETDNLLSSVIPHTAAASSSSPLIVTTMTTIRFVIRKYGLYSDDDDDNDGPNLTKCYISGGSAVYERVPSHTSLLPRPSHFAHSILFEQLDGMLREGVKKKTGKKRSGCPLGLPPPPRSGQENVKIFDFDFRLKILIIYDSKRILPKKMFFDH